MPTAVHLPLQRPLSGEPLSLDLQNTEWGLEEQHRDVLTTLDGMQAWLREVGLEAPVEQLSAVQAALRHTRAVMRRVLKDPQDETARAALNAVLERGRIVRTLGVDGPQERLEVPEIDRVAWLAADNLLDLLRTRPQQIRRCGNADCTLYFLDTSKNHSRTWCSMKTCGNRAKFQRHTHRQRARSSPIKT